MLMPRRGFLGGLAALGAGLFLPRPVFAAGPASLLDEARALARRPYRAPSGPLPPPFAGLDYDAYRSIRPIDGRSAGLELGQDFVVDLLPPGLFYQNAVTVELPDGDGWATVPFSPTLFDFGADRFGAVPDEAPGAGFSGLRLRHPIDRPGVMDEFLVLQGASYFRAVGRAMQYGLSARAVALGTGGAAPEEFPRFTRLRLHPPQGGAARLEAVIDSPSLAGHMTMVAHPGETTRLDLSVTLMPRRRLTDVGIAPLTSMYLKGPLRAAVSDDFRPRVHDSDVLVIANGAGDTLWRPIANPATLQTSAFADEDPGAFGLYQTARGFADYEDAEARYDRRPSARVTPAGDWGRGAVMLVEIPTGDEFMDNIVAFWRPEAPLEARSEHRFDYRIDWTADAPDTRSPARIVQTRSGRQHDLSGALRYVIDYEDAPEGVALDLGSNAGTVTGETLHPIPGGRLRASFLLAPGDADAVELRAALRFADGRAASPVWLHRWTRARDGGN
ncbi:glucan biosynthesis protein [Citreimonas sp.]|uniref:glucan biosynthesis protein n=1 Tax=Citreimonas sp. TaxID=3036715 RepID=UPI0035C84D79